jgi:hypothetical protein
MPYKAAVLAVCLTVCLISVVGAQTVEKPSTLKVFDTNGKFVGYVMGYQHPAATGREEVAIALRVDGVALLLSATRSGFIGNRGCLL